MKVLTTIFLLAISIAGFSQQLKLEFTNIDVDKGGQLMIALFDNKDNFLKTKSAIRKHRIIVTRTTHYVQFDSLPAGYYSVSVFHDENSNNELDTNFIKIPNEGYGFSNNPKFYGPPNWDKSNFHFDGTKKTIKIEIDY